MSQVDILDRYTLLKQRINAIHIPTLEDISSVANTLMVIATEPREWSNNVHIAYNTGWIADVSGSILLPVLQQEASKPDLSPADKQKIQGAINQLKTVHDDAKKL